MKVQVLTNAKPNICKLSRIFMKTIYLLISLLFFSNLYADSKYALGEGLQVGNRPMYIGGYVSTEYQDQNRTKKYSLDDISFLSYGSYEKFSYMAEFEFKELYTKVDDDNGSTINHNQKVYAERVYIDYTINDHYSLRTGKYNSPIGFWNLLPINVLRETTSSPVLTEIIFPKFTTGFDVSYSSFQENELKVDVMLQNNSALDDEYSNYKIDKHYGVGVSYEKSGYTLKFNGGYFHKAGLLEGDTNRDITYALLGGKYETDRFQFLAEAGTQRAGNGVTTPYAAYLQGTYHLNSHHSGTLRMESFENNINHRDDNIAVAGYTYRPLYPIALKLEYQLHTLKESDEILASFSVLF